MAKEPPEKQSAHSLLAGFVERELPELSEAFAKTPLMQLRIATPRGSVTMVKAQPAETMAPAVVFDGDARRAARPTHAYIPDAEPGRAYDTVTADVVGVFHAAPDLPGQGEEIGADRVLGYIEALKLRTPVRAGIAGRLVGQVAEEGQPVDFGETLFVVDSGPAEATAEQNPDGQAVQEVTPLEVEPPRI